jgi:hypothetical protein
MITNNMITNDMITNNMITNNMITNNMITNNIITNNMTQANDILYNKKFQKYLNKYINLNCYKQLYDVNLTELSGGEYSVNVLDNYIETMNNLWLKFIKTKTFKKEISSDDLVKILGIESSDVNLLRQIMLKYVLNSNKSVYIGLENGWDDPSNQNSKKEITQNIIFNEEDDTINIGTIYYLKKPLKKTRITYDLSQIMKKITDGQIQINFSWDEDSKIIFTNFIELITTAYPTSTDQTTSFVFDPDSKKQIPYPCVNFDYIPKTNNIHKNLAKFFTKKKFGWYDSTFKIPENTFLEKMTKTDKNNNPNIIDNNHVLTGHIPVHVVDNFNINFKSVKFEV